MDAASLGGYDVAWQFDKSITLTAIKQTSIPLQPGAAPQQLAPPFELRMPFTAPGFSATLTLVLPIYDLELDPNSATPTSALSLRFRYLLTCLGRSAVGRESA
jgi:hypothetical protein